MPSRAKEKVKTERWAIAVDEWPACRIVRAGSDDCPHSDERLNGTFPSRLAAVEKVIDDLEFARQRVALELARAKRMRARLKDPTPD